MTATPPGRPRRRLVVGGLAAGLLMPACLGIGFAVSLGDSNQQPTNATAAPDDDHRSMMAFGPG